jgi:hypothetical protein
LKYIKYSKELLEPIVSKSKSIADVIRALGLVEKGGNYRTIARNIDKFSIDASHFTGQGWAKGRSKSSCSIVAGVARSITKHSIENSLKYGTSVSSRTLYRLVKEAGLIEECARCGLGTEWNSKPIRLQVDHINGNSYDNQIRNLRFLCPNCHTQTSTFGNKNKHRYRSEEIVD